MCRFIKNFIILIAALSTSSAYAASAICVPQDDEIEWDAPLLDFDDITPVDDLASYTIYRGSVSGSYSITTVVPADSQFPPYRQVYNWPADLPPGDWYIAVKAKDLSGKESPDFSNEVCVTGPSLPDGPPGAPNLEPVGNTVFTLAGGDYNGTADFDEVIPWFSAGFSITATINLDPNSQRQPILTKQGNGERGITWEVNTSKLIQAEIWVTGATSPIIVNGVTVLSDGVDYLVGITHDGITMKLYVDGVEEVSVPVAFPRSNSQPVLVGRYPWAPSTNLDWYFNGRILNLVGEDF